MQENKGRKEGKEQNKQKGERTLPRLAPTNTSCKPARNVLLKAIWTVSSLRIELQKIPSRNHNRKTHTTKKSAVTRVPKAFRIDAFIDPSPPALPPDDASPSSSSIIILASSKSCCKESSTTLRREDDDAEKVADRAGDSSSLLRVVVVATDDDDDDDCDISLSEAIDPCARPPITSRTSIMSICTGMSSLAVSLIVLTATTGACGWAEDEDDEEVDDDSSEDSSDDSPSVGSFRFRRRFGASLFCCCSVILKTIVFRGGIAMKNPFDGGAKRLPTAWVVVVVVRKGVRVLG